MANQSLPPTHRPARSGDPETSWTAGLSVDARGRERIRETVLNILLQPEDSAIMQVHFGVRTLVLTHNQIFVAYSRLGGDHTEQRVRTAVSELVRMGLVRVYDREGESALGRPATRWVATGADPGEVDASPRRAVVQIPEVVDVVFDGGPGPEGGRFVEVEDQDGRSVGVGEWVERPDGYWALRLEVAGEVRRA